MERLEGPRYAVFDPRTEAFVTEDSGTFLYENREDAEALEMGQDGDHFQVVKVTVV